MRLNKLQKIVLVVYLIISGIIYYIYANQLLPRTDINKMIFYYGFGTPFGILIAYIHELRNNLNFIIWTLIGVIHYWIYSVNKTNMYFNVRDYSNSEDFVSFADKIGTLSTDSLKATLVVVLSIKLFGWIFKKMTDFNLIGTFCRFSWSDDNECRSINWLDVLFNLILFGITITAVMIKV